MVDKSTRFTHLAPFCVIPTICGKVVQTKMHFINGRVVKGGRGGPGVGPPGKFQKAEGLFRNTDMDPPDLENHTPGKLNTRPGKTQPNLENHTSNLENHTANLENHTTTQPASNFWAIFGPQAKRLWPDLFTGIFFYVRIPLLRKIS